LLEVLECAFFSRITKIIFLNKASDLRHRSVHPAQK
jgi:hypothetical protein